MLYIKQGGVFEFSLTRNICSLTALLKHSSFLHTVTELILLTLSLSLSHYTKISYSSIAPIRRCQGYYEASLCEPLVTQSDMQT